MNKYWITLLPLLLIGQLAWGIINIEEERVDAPEEGVHGQLKYALGGAQGNNDNLRFDGAGKIVYGFEKQQMMFIFNRAYAEVDDRPNVDRTFAHLRYTRPHMPRRDFEVFTQYQRDEFRSLQFRGLLGGGYRVTINQSSENVKNTFGIGAFFEREEFITDEEDSLDQVRGNLYWAFQGQLEFAEWKGSVPQFSNTLYYQPSLQFSNDTRALYLASLTFEVYQNVDLGFDLEIHHDSDPPVGIEQTDVAYRQTLQYRF